MKTFDIAIFVWVNEIKGRGTDEFVRLIAYMEVIWGKRCDEAVAHREDR